MKSVTLSFEFMPNSTVKPTYEGGHISATISEDGIVTLRDTSTYEVFLEMPASDWSYFAEFMDTIDQARRMVLIQKRGKAN